MRVFEVFAVGPAHAKNLVGTESLYNWCPQIHWEPAEEHIHSVLHDSRPNPAMVANDLPSDNQTQPAPRLGTSLAAHLSELPIRSERNWRPER